MGITREEAATVKCPKCGALPGKPCVYVTRRIDSSKSRGWPDVPYVDHFEGDPIPSGKTHYERNSEAFRKSLKDLPRKLDAYEASRKRKAEAWAAMREFDRREYEQLRDWLRDWGWLLTTANLPRRPDGTLRGETYLW